MPDRTRNLLREGLGLGHFSNPTALRAGILQMRSLIQKIRGLPMLITIFGAESSGNGMHDARGIFSEGATPTSCPSTNL